MITNVLPPSYIFMVILAEHVNDKLFVLVLYTALVQRMCNCSEIKNKILPHIKLIVLIYRVAQKNGTVFLVRLNSSNINQFSKLFHCQNQEKICNNTITKDPTTPQMCRYTTL